ncbi:exosortase A [Photobacterium gaetbulicola]|uniref:exosortase A n=1 Tax=Photobacterium gaetbulicola TaxID=1295392 RepID=UPI00068E1806|nr:exosortase A [Photobacterium gaetbulicola]
MGQNKFVLMLLPIIGWGLVYNQAFLDMISIWGASKTYEHGFLIIPICLWVAWLQRHQFMTQPQSIAWLPIFLLPLPNLLWLIGYAADIALFEHVAAVTSFQLILWAMLGTPRAKVMWFPICYLVFCIPFGEQLIAPLQQITANLAIFFLQLANIPALHEGLSITIPNGHFFVAEACSGIRFLISSLALGCLFAYFQFTKVWKRLAFIGFSFIFPIIANGIRAAGIIMIGYYTDMAHATGADHLIYGWVFFSIIIFCIFLVANRFADPLPTPGKRSAPIPVINVPATKAVGLTTVLLLSFALWGKNITLSEEDILATPPMIDDSHPAKDTTWGITFPHASKTLLATNPVTDTYYYTARYSLWQPKGELISSENALFDKDVWSINHSAPLVLDPQTQANSLSLISKTGAEIQIVYWYCINTFCSNDPITIKLVKAGLLIIGERGHADVFAIASPDAKLAEQHARKWLAVTNANP